MSKKAFIIALALGAPIATAQAATRTICGEFRFKDARPNSNCATAFETGNLRGCNSGNDMDHLGIVVELWDKDGDGSDEKIGAFRYTASGGTCWTFEWDNNATANAEHEAHPDVYPVYLNTVFDTGGNRGVVAIQSNGAAHSVLSWRNGDSGLPDKYVAVDCTGSCWMFGSGYLLPSTDATTAVSKRAMALDSAQHFLQVFAGVMSANVNMKIPADGNCGGGSCALSQTLFTIIDSHTTEGVTIAHELGHTLQMQRFGQNTLFEDCSKNGAAWTITSSEHDSCATTEGIATYAGAASWYDGGVANTSPNLLGVNFEVPTPHNNTSCVDNRGIVLQVVRAFWDMDDVTNELGAGVALIMNDTESWFPTHIMGAWVSFPNGTNNQQNDENDQHGVNVWDYNFVTAGPQYGNPPGMEETLIHHNCLQNQDQL